MGVTKFNKSIGDVLVRAVKMGAYRRHAAALAGITDRTLRNWIAWGLDGDEVYHDWAVEFTQAETTSHSEWFRCIVDIGKKGQWKALAWALERVDPKTFYLPTKLEHSGADGAPLHTAVTPQRAAEIMRGQFGNVGPQTDAESDDGCSDDSSGA